MHTLIAIGIGVVVLVAGILALASTRPGVLGKHFETGLGNLKAVAER